ncbi:MAG: GNAT family protein [Candidatus Margulisiibacteriota bacterium]
MIEKYKVKARKANYKDIELIKSWLKNSDFATNLYYVPSHDDKALKEKVLSMLREGGHDLASKRYFIIESEKLCRPIGMVMFHDIVWRNKNLAMDVLVGDDSLKNKIWGLILSVEGIKIAFETFNMHKIVGTIYSYNKNSDKLFKAFDGIVEGVYKDFVIKNGKRYDATVYAMFKRDHPALLEKLKKY